MQNNYNISVFLSLSHFLTYTHAHSTLAFPLSFLHIHTTFFISKPYKLGYYQRISIIYFIQLVHFLNLYLACTLHTHLPQSMLIMLHVCVCLCLVECSSINLYLRIILSSSSSSSSFMFLSTSLLVLSSTWKSKRRFFFSFVKISGMSSWSDGWV